MQKLNVSCKPKITLILKRDNKAHYLYPSPRKTQKILINKAESYLKNRYSITIRVTYGYAKNVFGKRVLFQNIGTYDDITSLRWAYQAFVKEYLNEL